MERPNTAKSLSPSVLVAGVVLDILTNQPIPDVAVYQQSNGESAGVYTDAAGIYVLQVDPAEPLRLSHVSYEPETLSVPADGGEVVHYLVPAAHDLGEGAEVFGDGPTPGPGPEPASAGVPWAVLLVLFGVGYVATRRRPLFRRNG